MGHFHRHHCGGLLALRIMATMHWFGKRFFLQGTYLTLGAMWRLS